MSNTQRPVTPEDIDRLQILPELITHHLEERGECPAVSDYDNKAKCWRTLSFRQVHEEALRWARAFKALGLRKGDRVAMLLPNGVDAVLFDQGALKAGLVPVPLHIIDTPANCAYILQNSEAKALVVLNKARWNAIQKASEHEPLPALKTVVLLEDEPDAASADDFVTEFAAPAFLAKGDAYTGEIEAPAKDDLGCLIYTSGTTGKPKGVMLTHDNIMSDIRSLLRNICPNENDVWLSFLPLSHMFERTTSYYIGLGMGNHVYFSRGIARLVEDLKTVRPTLIMSVPRVYERVYSKIQERLRGKGAVARMLFEHAVSVGWRQFRRENHLPPEPGNSPMPYDALLLPIYDRLVSQTVKSGFGGRVRAAVSGGAALNINVARMFVGLGIPILQGYGMTETSPIISVNKIGCNDPETVGQLLQGMEARLGEKDELQVRGPQIMKGYWKLPAETAKVLTEDGWLGTGDQCDILPGNFLRIKGRIKEIIVTSTGEKIAPVDVEQKMECDPLFAQAFVLGENRPFVTAVAVLHGEEWKDLAKECGVDPADPAALSDKKVRMQVLKRVKRACAGLPQYGVPRAVHLTLDPWTIENGMLTPTLKLKRRILNKQYEAEIESLYQNFGQ